MPFTCTCCMRRTFSAIPMPSRWRVIIDQIVQQGLRLKKTGNQIVTLMGGREIHPVSAAVGGFYKVPTKSALKELVGRTEMGARRLAGHSHAGFHGFEFPDFEQDYEFVSLSHPARVSVQRGPDRIQPRAGY